MTDSTICKWTGLGAAVAFALLLSIATTASASELISESKQGYDWRGPYAKLGLAIGFPDEKSSFPDVDPGAGFDLAGGWRLAPWLAAEADMNFIAGADVSGTSKDMQIFAFTVNAKGYPLGALQTDAIPQDFQPYVLMGLGGGEVEVGSFDEGSFIFRIGGGVDMWFAENFGAYFDAGYQVITDDDTGLNGEGLIVLGAMCRF